MGLTSKPREVIRVSIDFSVVKNTTLPEVLRVNSGSFSDHRGKIYTTYRDRDFTDLGLPVFTHDKIVVSRPNVLRGIHGDFKTYKLVSCVFGCVEQVVVDCRPASITYKKWTKYQLDGESGESILIPPGFGNAFLVTGDSKAIYNYKLSYEGEYLDADEQFTYAWNDESIGVNWSISEPILSIRDGQN